jgi:hypothetical protein
MSEQGFCINQICLQHTLPNYYSLLLLLNYYYALGIIP